MLLIRHIYQLTLTGLSFIKKTPLFLRIRAFNYQKLVCEEFLMYLFTGTRCQISTVLITISFPKIDKDLINHD